jgi:hypothetical protein
MIDGGLTKVSPPHVPRPTCPGSPRPGSPGRFRGIAYPPGREVVYLPCGRFPWSRLPAGPEVSVDPVTGRAGGFRGLDFLPGGSVRGSADSLDEPAAVGS